MQDYNKTHQKSSGIPAVSSDGTIHFLLIKYQQRGGVFIADEMLLLTIAGVSVVMDLYKMRVKNSWVLCSFLAGAVTCFWQKGFAGLTRFIPGILMPLAVLGWMFYFRMLGPGDIKVFCALGGIMGTCKDPVVYLVFLSVRSRDFTLPFCSAVEESGRGWRIWRHILWSICRQAATNPIIEGKVHRKIFISRCPYL